MPLDKQHSASLSGHFCVCGVGGVAARFWTGNWHRDVGTCVQHLFCVQGDTPRMQEGDIGQESRGLSPVTKGSAHRSGAWRPRITWLQVLGDTPSPHGHLHSALYCCCPRPRVQATQATLHWGLELGTRQLLFSSDKSYQFHSHPPSNYISVISTIIIFCF